ncbi:hypothetical protein HAX54_044575 [Datura stramonium]|uniref:Uncharacterized protein n=1 Tax=Datura stramonium TaxID=4076 RepID=A0ABS8SPV1_DATST|nr:hypothetical protein [Datura stramonium]
MVTKTCKNYLGCKYSASPQLIGPQLFSLSNREAILLPGKLDSPSSNKARSHDRYRSSMCSLLGEKNMKDVLRAPNGRQDMASHGVLAASENEHDV